MNCFSRNVAIGNWEDFSLRCTEKEALRYFCDLTLPSSGHEGCGAIS